MTEEARFSPTLYVCLDKSGKYTKIIDQGELTKQLIRQASLIELAELTSTIWPYQAVVTCILDDKNFALSLNHPHEKSFEQTKWSDLNIDPEKVKSLKEETLNKLLIWIQGTLEEERISANPVLILLSTNG